jgi:hypothetical protein
MGQEKEAKDNWRIKMKQGVESSPFERNANNFLSKYTYLDTKKKA